MLQVSSGGTEVSTGAAMDLLTFVSLAARLKRGGASGITMATQQHEETIKFKLIHVYLNLISRTIRYSMYNYYSAQTCIIKS